MIGGEGIKKNITKNIVKYREKAGISQKELAKKLNISPSRISNWEQGANCPTIEILFELCKILQVSINDIYGVYPDSEITLSYEEQEYIKKYRFVSQHSMNGTNMVDAVLDKEYMMAENRKNLEEEIKELKSRLDSKEVHMPEMPNDIEKYEAAKKAKEPTEYSKYVNKDTDYVNAAHPIEGASEEDKQFDEDIMDGEDF